MKVSETERYPSLPSLSHERFEGDGGERMQDRKAERVGEVEGEGEGNTERKGKRKRERVTSQMRVPKIRQWCGDSSE